MLSLGTAVARGNCGKRQLYKMTGQKLAAKKEAQTVNPDAERMAHGAAALEAESSTLQWQCSEVLRSVPNLRQEFQEGKTRKARNDRKKRRAHRHTKRTMTG